MKAFTDIQQSKKLAEILPIESTDMFYYKDAVTKEDNPRVMDYSQVPKNKSMYYFPCWSLAALLDVLNKTAYFIDEDASVNLSSYKAIEWYLGINNSDLELITKVNPIDACVEMIIKLHELKML